MSRDITKWHQLGKRTVKCKLNKPGASTLGRFHSEAISEAVLALWGLWIASESVCDVLSGKWWWGEREGKDRLVQIASSKFFWNVLVCKVFVVVQYSIEGETTYSAMKERQLQPGVGNLSIWLNVWHSNPAAARWCLIQLVKSTAKYTSAFILQVWHPVWINFFSTFQD